MAFGDWFLQTEQAKLQLEQLKMQQELAMAQQYHQQYPPTSISGLINQYAPGPGQITPITTCSTSGMGSYATSAIYQQMAQASQVTAAQTGIPYYVALPPTPKQGDKITVYFDGIKWMETRDCPSELATVRAADHSGFSLHELETAQSIMEECSGSG